MTRNRFITILAILTILFVIGGLLWFVQDKTGIAEKQVIRNGETTTATTSVQNNIVDTCLQNNENANFSLQSNKKSEDYFTVEVKDINSGSIIIDFTDTIQSATHYHPIELHKCAVYVLRMFNWDYQTQKPLSNYSSGLWKYNYDGQGSEIVDLDSYGTDFRISPNEKYVALIKSYFGKDDYALVIKSLDTTTDASVVIANDMFQTHDNVIGTFRFLEWTEDGRYFWARISQGAHVYGWIRIDTQDWSHDVYEAPE